MIFNSFRFLRGIPLLILIGFVCAGSAWGEVLVAPGLSDSPARLETAVEGGQVATGTAVEIQANTQERLMNPAAAADVHETDNPPIPLEPEVRSDVAAQPETGEAPVATAGAEGVNNAVAVQEPSLYRLAVIGVSNQTGEKEFSKLLIAQGVSQLVAQALFDTGRYVPVEDNPEITGRINELVALAASNSEQPFDGSQVDAQLLGCDATASAAIKKFSKSRMRGFAGPFSAANVDIEIEVEVAVREPGKPVMAASGRGTGTTKSRGVLFQVREDKVHFDQTSVGQATEAAVQQAVSRLLAQRGEGG